MSDAANEADEELLQTLYTKLLESLAVLERAQVLSMMEPSETEMREVCARYDAKLEDEELTLQAAVQDYEVAQRALAAKLTTADAAELEKLRAESKAASEEMEECIGRRTETSVAYAEVRASVLSARPIVPDAHSSDDESVYTRALMSACAYAACRN